MQVEEKWNGQRLRNQDAFLWKYEDQLGREVGGKRLKRKIRDMYKRALKTVKGA